ncbi:hypothetical protein ILYODFUR_036797 [Ilyodon furcidens]|uniref:Uncharacterized protein n=1 Tax=Ilyodon furcidens TaxID=33524 RepID=A0ABV0SUE9_9TELE
MEFKRKFNLEDSPPLSPLQPINIKSSSLSSQSSFKLRFKRPSFTEPPDLQPSLNPPPPHLLHPASKLLQAPLPPQASTPPPVGSQGEVISNSNSKLFIQAHIILSVQVFLRGPSAKEINFR